MLTLFATLVLVGASLPEVVDSDQSCPSDCNKKNRADPKNPIAWMYNGDGYNTSPPVPTTGRFHIWSLVSNHGDSLLKLSENNGRFSIECSGSFNQDLAQFEDTTVYPTETLAIKFQSSGPEIYYLSIRRDTKEVIARELKGGPIFDNERLITWPQGSFMMFESKLHPDHFLGCTKEGAAQLFPIHAKRRPDPRTLFVINDIPPTSGGN